MGRRSVAAAGLEAAATGIFLVILPGLFGALVLGSELSAGGEAMARLAGIVLICFGFACWPGGHTDRSEWMLRQMQLYNLLAAIYLVYLGMRGMTGILLLPAVGIHAVLLLFLAHTSYRGAVATTG